MGELAALADQHVGHTVADQHPAQRDITGRHALGKRHQVGLDAEVFAAEPVAETAESANHFIGDQQDAVLVADALDFRPVSRWRNDHAACALHRLTDEGADLVGTDVKNLFFQP